MKEWLSVLALLLCACTPPAEQTPTPEGPPIQRDAAGNTLQPLAPRADAAMCTADGALCVIDMTDHALVVVTENNTARELPPIVYRGDGEFELWPWAVRQADGAMLIGITSTVRESYSGGDASATHLTLRDPQRENAPLVLVAPLAGEANIRACFSEDDAAERQGACQDSYSFSGQLSLDEANTEGGARLLLSTDASTYPGRRSRSEDSTQSPPLKPEDLVRWTDETCSYRRAATWDAATSAYVYDAPLPACRDYLEP